jgi:hypothetical protein
VVDQAEEEKVVIIHLQLLVQPTLEEVAEVELEQDQLAVQESLS